MRWSQPARQAVQTSRSQPVGAALLVGVIALVAIGGHSAASRGAAPGPAPDEALFDLGRLLEVRIELAPADWDALRLEHHDLLAALGPTRFDKPEPDPYHTYRARVTIDGESVGWVGIRKRGFLGSASAQRPSLGLRFDAFEPDNRFHGLRRMSLNNNLQDPSQLHQVLAYRVFSRAGVPAPRCNLARVTVNGKLLGIYSHVEAIDARFLERHFGRADGSLYEGLLSDFRPEWVKTFEKKLPKDDPDRSDLEAVVRALQSDDRSLVARLERCVDVEEYLSFWAVEALINHWDSYSGNGNNFFVYRSPATGRFAFIPWGADAVFGDRDPFTPVPTPESVKARSLLPRRLYHLPGMRQRYRDRLRRLLDMVWDESGLLGEVNRLEALLQGKVHVSPSQFRQSVEQVRRFIRTRRAELKKELDGPAPEWPLPLRSRGCLEKAGTMTALFSTRWQTGINLNPASNDVATVELKLGGARPDFAYLSVRAGPATDARHEGHPTVSFLGLGRGSLKVTVLALVVQPEFYKARAVVNVNGFEVGGVLLQGALWGERFRIAGIPIGTLRLQEAGTRPGDPVSGRLQVDLYKIPE